LQGIEYAESTFYICFIIIKKQYYEKQENALPFCFRQKWLYA
jgi:hypothetical protein